MSPKRPRESVPIEVGTLVNVLARHLAGVLKVSEREVYRRALSVRGIVGSLKRREYMAVRLAGTEPLVKKVKVRQPVPQAGSTKHGVALSLAAAQRAIGLADQDGITVEAVLWEGLLLLLEFTDLAEGEYLAICRASGDLEKVEFLNS